MHMDSPLGRIRITADAQGLTGIVFINQKKQADSPDQKQIRTDLPVFLQACQWLENYFAGEIPGELPALHLKGTEFQQEVWEMLRRIPYGAVVTYGDLAKELAVQRGMKRMSAQAVGSAVGRNPVPVLLPCHRVIGKDGKLTGYAYGLDRKQYLLELEGWGFDSEGKLSGRIISSMKK